MEVRAYADRIELRQDGRVVGEHVRAFGRGGTVYNPWHYVPVLARKPGALRTMLAVVQPRHYGAPHIEVKSPRITMVALQHQNGDPHHRNFLVYDGDCPVCNRYVLWTRIRELYPDIALLDAREHPDLVVQLRAEGIEPNDTMLLQVDGRRYVGGAAMEKLGSYIQPATLAQKAIHYLARYPRLLNATYPALVAGRKALLALLGRKPIT